MTIASMRRMLVSDHDGWDEVVRTHPSIRNLALYMVAPFSLIPAIMYPYAELMYPGQVFALLEPPMSTGEAMFVGIAFFLMQLAMVQMMATFIQQIGESFGVRASDDEAYALAAIAPTPLWLSALALFVPSLSFAIGAVALAWIGSVALIRHGIRPLLHLDDDHKIRQMAAAVTATGVVAWMALLIVMALTVSLVLGWR